MKFTKTAPCWGPIVISVVLFSCSEKWPPHISIGDIFSKDSSGNSALGNGLFARINTSRGEIVLRLEYEKAPLTVCNFVALAEGAMDVCKGKPFYNGLTFHRVIPNFMIQGGDPQGNGSGGPGYKFADEFDPSLRHDGPGVLSMANAGPGTNGSQFFITHTETPWLDDHHTVFGRVVTGQDVVNAIQQGDTIKEITIVRNGSAARSFKANQAAFNNLSVKAKESAEAKAKARQKEDLARIAAKYPNLETDANGVFYRIEKQGSGAKPVSGATVQVSYKGMFLSGEVFDASDAHGGPLEFKVGIGQVIPGWDKSIIDMKTGEKRLVVIPPELAYGERGAGGVIPPNAFLVFEMELIAVK